MLKNFLFWFLVLILLSSGIWYFILKPEDYRISFETPVPAGRLYYHLKGWDYKHLTGTRILKEEAFHFVKQEAFLEQDSLNLHWDLTPATDSLTRVEVRITHHRDQFRKRLRLLFSQPDYQDKVKQEILLFKKALEAAGLVYRVRIQGPDTIPETTCACLGLQSTVEDKAFEMMRNIGFLSDYILAHDLEMAARPRVDITSWDHATGRIDFDFCFPLKSTQKPFPKTSRIFIKTIPEEKALKAIFNGNYMFSHQAWLSLYQYAEKRGSPPGGTPLEVFNSNPEMGGDTSTWEAEIYLRL